MSESKEKNFAGSEADTILMSPDSPKEKAQPLESYARKDLESFVKFANQTLSIGVKEPGKSLPEIIYSEFCNYSESSAQEVEFFDRESPSRYLANAYKILEHNNENRKIEEARISMQPGWLYGNINRGVDRKIPIGRIYLNIHLPRNLEVYESMLSLLFFSGARVDLKTPSFLDREQLKKTDRIVLYFNPADTVKVLDIVRKIYEKHVDDFKLDKPKFCLPIKASNESENYMKGIGFGQEPDYSGSSFNILRAVILSKVYRAIGQGAFRLNDSLEIAGRFKKECLKEGVNPLDPAFNLMENNLFAELRD